MNEREPYIVEYNWKHELGEVGGKPFHIEPLRSRVEKNIGLLLCKGKPGNTNWVIVGVCEGIQEANKCAEAFLALLKQEIRILR